MISSISVDHQENAIKTAQIINLLKPWNYALNSFSKIFKKQTQQGILPTKQAKTKTNDLNFQTILNARQVKSVYNQAYANYQSYLKIKQETIKQTITNSSLNDIDKTILYRINSQQKWFIKNPELAWKIDSKTGELSVPTNKDYKTPDSLVFLPVESSLMKLIRHIFKHSKGQLANFKHNRTMIMDGTIATRETNKISKTFDYWLKITTLTKRKPVNIPIKSNNYLNNRIITAKKFINTIQVQILEDKNIKINLLIEHENVDKRKENIILGIDSNFNDNNLFAISDGSLYGGAFVQWLKQMDEKIIKRQKFVQQNGLSFKKDDQYKRLNKRVRDFSKNEINRVINNLIKDYKVSDLVVERLDFRGSGLSKRMNRLLTRMGRKLLRQKLDRVGDSHGVSVLKINPAFSSQECSTCGFVDKKNRRGLVFVCQCCNKRLHADVNASRVLVSRRSANGTDIFDNVSKEKTRELLQGKHALSCAIHARSLNRVTGTEN